MIVVADTSPLNYLVLIDMVQVLEQLYDRVCIPIEVISELQSPEAPELVRQWAAASPPWIEVHVRGDDQLEDPRWLSLHSGERSALTLAAALHADLILIDERLGAGVARKSGFRVTGTLGVLDEAARLGLLDLPEAIARLATTTFRYPRALIVELLAEDALRRIM